MAASRQSVAVPAPFALPLGCTALLMVGAIRAGLGHRVGAAVAIVGVALVLAAMSAVAEPLAVLILTGVGWATASAFAAAPYGQLRVEGHNAFVAALVVPVSALAGLGVQLLRRRSVAARIRRTLMGVEGLASLASAVDRRRQAIAVAAGAVALPALTAILCSQRAHMSLADEVLFYLLVVVAVAVLGGFWPAVASAIAASLLLNWYFTKPLHTFTIQQPDNLLALMLFIVAAMAVSSVVHLSARRAQLAARSNAEAELLLDLARTALFDDGSPDALLRYLHQRLGVSLELSERHGTSWIRLASAGPAASTPYEIRPIGPDLRLVLHAKPPAELDRLLDAAIAQIASALERDRLRTQAAQAEALAAGNRLRTALLAAVSHDLRTPLATIKAAISSLRQTDVHWAPEDEQELLETIEESTDRLDSLIANLLDMSRVQTGALQPYLRPAAIDETALLALQGVPGGRQVQVDIPEDLPLLRTDQGLLERALANVLANAIRWSPPDRPPLLSAFVHDGRVVIAVVDHGPGVAVADRGRIFEPFQRLGDQDASSGVGLGLAVARGFVDALGGEMEASETPGGGLTMTITLPAAQTPSPRSTAHEVSSA